MSGVTIISQTDIPKQLMGDARLIIILFIIATILIGLCVVPLITDKLLGTAVNVSAGMFYIGFILFALWLGFYQWRLTQETKTLYEVTITEDVDFDEFTQAYHIINQKDWNVFEVCTPEEAIWFEK